MSACHGFKPTAAPASSLAYNGTLKFASPAHRDILGLTFNLVDFHFQLNTQRLHFKGGTLSCLSSKVRRKHNRNAFSAAGSVTH